MRVLVACEFSGTVRDAFARRGHDAWSCDLRPSERPGNHIVGDAREAARRGWDLLIAHPPCTHLAISGAQWFAMKKDEQDAAVAFFLDMLNAPVRAVCVENPVGVVSTYVRRPDQIIQPWMFGDEAQKTTCLWLKNLPRLRPTKVVGKGEFMVMRSGKRQPKWYATAHYGGADRRLARSRTFPGVAEAMAGQWGRPYTTGLGVYVPHRRIQ